MKRVTWAEDVKQHDGLGYWNQELERLVLEFFHRRGIGMECCVKALDSEIVQYCKTAIVALVEKIEAADKTTKTPLLPQGGGQAICFTQDFVPHLRGILVMISRSS